MSVKFILIDFSLNFLWCDTTYYINPISQPFDCKVIIKPKNYCNNRTLNEKSITLYTYVYHSYSTACCLLWFCLQHCITCTFISKYSVYFSLTHFTDNSTLLQNPATVWFTLRYFIYPSLEQIPNPIH